MVCLLATKIHCAGNLSDFVLPPLSSLSGFRTLHTGTQVACESSPINWGHNWKPFLSSCQVFSYAFHARSSPWGEERCLWQRQDSVTRNFADKSPYQTAFCRPRPRGADHCHEAHASKLSHQSCPPGLLARRPPPLPAPQALGSSKLAEAFRSAPPACPPRRRHRVQYREPASHARADTREVVTWVGQQRDGSRGATVPGAGIAPEAFTHFHPIATPRLRWWAVTSAGLIRVPTRNCCLHVPTGRRSPRISYLE